MVSGGKIRATELLLPLPPVSVSVSMQKCKQCLELFDAR